MCECDKPDCKECHNETLREAYEEYFNHIDMAGGQIPLCFDNWLKAGKYEH